MKSEDRGRRTEFASYMNEIENITTQTHVISILKYSIEMPFSCKFQLNNGAISEKEEVIFEEFIESAFGNFHPNTVNIARVFVNGKSAFISSTCPCFPSSMNMKVLKGSKIQETTIIGYFSANGEDIPYDKPYAQIVFDDTNGN
ncbi:MAG: hypothetical protein VYB44_15875 [Bacteroidota bacterium]|nr:hypothetical protein [Bacteroidota bacterium]